MWWAIPLTILFVTFVFPSSIFLFVEGIKGYRDKKENKQ